MKKNYPVDAIFGILLLLNLSLITSNAQPTCSDYLVHYWKLNEQNPSILSDYSGLLNATASVATIPVAGIQNNGQYFNGSSEVTIADDNSFDWSANASFAIEFWIKKTTSCTGGSSGNNVIIGRDDPASQLHWWIGVSCDQPGKIDFNLISTDGNGYNLVGNKNIIDGTWHHVVVMRNGNNQETSIYIDGTIDASVTHSYSSGFSSNVPVNLGWLNLDIKYHLDATLDELALYDRVLSSSEILSHYNGGNGTSYCTIPPDTISTLKILPLGNSITFDDYSNDVRPDGLRISYRRELYNLLTEAGINFDFVGSEVAGQDLFPDPENGGFPGINKEQMVTLLQTGYNQRTSTQEIAGPYLTAFQPDIILLHIGTNDLTTNVTAIEQILDIIDEYRNESGKSVKLLIAKIINRKAYHSATTTYNNNLAAAVAAHNHPDNYLVDMENGAGIDYDNDMIDNLHPNANGYAKMANLWFQHIMDILDPNEPTLTNVAPGKPSSQSSTRYGGVASRANDNNTDGFWENNSVAHTGYQLNSWWQVDLQASYHINQIVVWNRTDPCCKDRLTNYYVFVSDNPFASNDLNTTLAQAGVWNSFHSAYPNPSTTIPVNQSGRYVRIQLADEGELNMAELQVFGSSGPPPVVTQPSAPSSLNALAVSSGSISVTWTDNSSNETGFRLDRKTEGGSFAQVTELAANATTYTDNTVLASTTYTYRVYAFNSAGNSSFSNEASATTPNQSTVTNVAPGKPSSQSSTKYGGIASRANDDNTNGFWENNSVAHTGYELNSWWQVDLQASYQIDQIVVWNRTDPCCKDRLTNFYVFVSDNPFTSTALNTTLNQSGVWNSYSSDYPNPSKTFPVNRTGRYIRIQLANQGEINLAEVQVFGHTGTVPTETIPIAPSVLSGQINSPESITIQWNDNSTNENGFGIERKSGGTSFQQIGQVGPEITTYTDNNVVESTNYTYRVYAYNAEGNSAYSNELTVTTPDPQTMTNLAPGKIVSQSSTAYGGVATRANDNNTSGSWSNGSIAHTLNEPNPWWEIDLQAIYPINQIVIWNRTDPCCTDRLVNYYVFVSETSFVSKSLNTTLNQSGVWNAFNANSPDPGTTIPVNHNGRYVRIQLANQGEINMAELQVFGTSSLKSTQRFPNNVDENNDVDLKVFPNPFSGNLNVQFTVNSDGANAYLSVCNLMGQEIQVLARGSLNNGLNTFNWDGRNNEGSYLGSGMYIIKLIINNSVHYKKVVLTK